MYFKLLKLDVFSETNFMVQKYFFYCVLFFSYHSISGFNHYKISNLYSFVKNIITNIILRKAEMKNTYYWKKTKCSFTINVYFIHILQNSVDSPFLQYIIKVV